MADERKSREEWIAEEEARLRDGFKYEPPPDSQGPEGAGTSSDEALAGLGLGAGIVAGAVAPHANPVTFQGVSPSVLAAALQAELTDDDTLVRSAHTAEALVVTILQSRRRGTRQFLPAVAVTLLTAGDTLTVTLSELSKGVMGDALGSIGGTLLEHGWDMATNRPGGIGGLIDTVGHVVQGAGEIADSWEDLKIPKRAWAIIDRVGEAAERAYLDEQRRAAVERRAREAALHAWTHCPYCGRAYEADEAELTNCPSCRGPRGPKPSETLG